MYSWNNFFEISFWVSLIHKIKTAAPEEIPHMRPSTTASFRAHAKACKYLDKAIG